MKAVMFAAGRGTRLGATGPKVLLEIGGRTLLEWHALRLSEVGVSELVVVTGYAREPIAAVLPQITRAANLTLREIVNERFPEGSVLSFLSSLPELEIATDSVLLMDADVLYPTAMLRRLIDSPHRTALLLDRNYSTSDDDPVLVPVKNGRPFEFRKGWNGPADFVGESVGFFKVAADDLALLAEETRARSAGRECTDSYDEVLRAMVMGGRFGYEDVTELPWTEIDFPEDVIRARDEILPAIEGVT